MDCLEAFDFLMKDTRYAVKLDNSDKRLFINNTFRKDTVAELIPSTYGNYERRNVFTKESFMSSFLGAKFKINW